MADNQEQPGARNGQQPRIYAFSPPWVLPPSWEVLHLSLSDTIQGQLEQARQRQADLQRDVANLRQELQQGRGATGGDQATVQADLLQEVQRLRDEISRQSVFLVFSLFIYEVTNKETGLREKNNTARVINSGANRNSTALEPLYGVNGELVPDFPATFGDAKALDGKCLCLFLQQGRSNLN